MLAILRGYGVGNFLQKIWNMYTMIPKQAGFFGKPFSASRGVRQGNIASPIIFNIVANAVILECLKV
jgi:hypothetical protein